MKTTLIFEHINFFADYILRIPIQIQAYGHYLETCANFIP